ncbi:Mu transposase domain-containing protein [Aeromonas allosaccharophila]|uniref:Mu transposase domain-containing protein n=1 Tax=Aeromonas allosaccharophila TaxID=656 RepID=UPI0035B9CA2E
MTLASRSSRGTELDGKERRFNPRFLALMSHYVIEPVACTPASGWEKGQVEKQVQDVRRRCFTPRRKVDSLAELNRRLIQELELAAQTRPHPDDPSQTVWQCFEQERTTLRPLAPRFNGYVERELRVDSTCLIHFDRNTYSVDSRYAHRHVTARVFADRLQVYAQSELIADHPRQFGRDKTQFDPWHYLDLLEHKPGALHHGAPFKEWALPPTLSRLQQQLLSRKGGDRDMVKLLLAARKDGLTLLEQACQQVLQLGGSSAELVLNHLQRLRRPVEVPQVHTQVVPLTQPPQANCQRYDSLLPGGHHVSR